MQKGKHNQFKQQKSVYLIPALKTTALCPVRVLIKWYNKLHTAGGSKYLIPNLRGDRTVIKDSKVSYNNLRAQWIRLLQRTNIREETRNNFGMHSLRISAATNASYGCGELEIQCLGCWKSMEMARSYVH